MSTREDAQNAVLPPEASPGAIAEAMEDPTVFEQIARGDLYMQMVKMRALAANPSMPFAQRLEYGRFLSKMGRVEQELQAAANQSTVPTIQIMFPGSGQSVQIGASAPAQREPIEHEPEPEYAEVVEPDEEPGPTKAQMEVSFDGLGVYDPDNP